MRGSGKPGDNLKIKFQVSNNHFSYERRKYLKLPLEKTIAGISKAGETLTVKFGLVHEEKKEINEEEDWMNGCAMVEQLKLPVNEQEFGNLESINLEL